MTNNANHSPVWDLPSDREAAAREENVMANENAPRAYTAEEVRTQLLEHIWGLIRYWAGLDGSNVPEGCNHMDRLEGLAHSLLVTLDGCSMDLPAFGLVLEPHPDDKDYHIEKGERYYPEGLDITEDHMLHELLYRKEIRQDRDVPSGRKP